MYNWKLIGFVDVDMEVVGLVMLWVICMYDISMYKYCMYNTLLTN